MISPSSDKAKIKEILSTDNYLSKSGFKNILTSGKTSAILNSTNPDLQIFISLAPPERSYSEIIKNVVYRITITGKRSFTDKIDKASEQITALLDSAEIGNGHILYLLDNFMELDSNPSIYALEATFLCQSTIFNKIKQ